MYRYIKGEITQISGTDITIECHDIGYLVRVPNPYSFALGSKITLHLYQHVCEDAIELFGFATPEERNLFLRLINVKGLGPKGALAILASSTPEEIVKAIEAGNPRYFNAFPGIGQKISQQIILDLKGKLKFDEAPGPVNPKLAEVESALKALGYKTTEIRAVTKDLSFDDQTSTGELVKIALRRLSKN